MGLDLQTILIGISPSAKVEHKCPPLRLTGIIILSTPNSFFCCSKDDDPTRYVMFFMLLHHSLPEEELIRQKCGSSRWRLTKDALLLIKNAANVWNLRHMHMCVGVLGGSLGGGGLMTVHFTVWPAKTSITYTSAHSDSIVHMGERAHILHISHHISLVSHYNIGATHYNGRCRDVNAQEHMNATVPCVSAWREFIEWMLMCGL